MYIYMFADYKIIGGTLSHLLLMDLIVDMRESAL
jgi:hypothetical protein